jgi:CBS domain-containing protein
MMTTDPVCCLPDTTLQEVARLMRENDCGSLPVVENKDSMRLVGIITDRDITCRAVAGGKRPHETTARDCMSTSVTTVSPETSLEECCSVMESKQVRRVPVVDKNSACCGVIAQADIARHGSEKFTAEVVREVSQPRDIASQAVS